MYLLVLYGVPVIDTARYFFFLVLGQGCKIIPTLSNIFYCLISLFYKIKLILFHLYFSSVYLSLSNDDLRWLNSVTDKDFLSFLIGCHRPKVVKAAIRSESHHVLLSLSLRFLETRWKSCWKSFFSRRLFCCDYRISKNVNY